MRIDKTKFIIALALILLGILGRVTPHIWNFTPIVAISIFSAFYLGRKYAVIVPLLSVIISDFFIDFYDPKIMLPVYGSFVLIGLFSYFLRKKTNFVITSLSSSTIFFIITNFAVWMFSGIYQLTISGLLNCYILALPFYRNAILGDLFYTGTLFALYAIVLYLLKSVFNNINVNNNAHKSL